MSIFKRVPERNDHGKSRAIIPCVVQKAIEREDNTGNPGVLRRTVGVDEEGCKGTEVYVVNLSCRTDTPGD